MRGRSTAAASMPSHQPPPDSRRHSATTRSSSSSSRRDVHPAHASTDLTHANYNRHHDDDDLPKILQHPFYLWSALFFLATYLCNHATFPRLPSSSGIGSSGGGMRYRYNRQRPQTTTPDVDADVGTDSSGTASIDVSTIQRPDLASLGLTDADGSGNIMKKPLIGVTTCASSRNWEHLPFQSMSLSRMMLPSLLGTMESDRFRYRLYVGIDDTDSFWNSGENQDRLRQMAGKDRDGGGGGTGGTTGGEGLEVVFHSFPQPSGGHRIPLNEICREAYVDGADYIVRINDDTEFVTPYWTSLGVRRLRSFQPPNVGVVGPTCHQGNREILTHDMVHRTHVDIFGTYYPKDFKNWYVDDWISQVYDKERTRMLGKWEVKHHIGYHGTRYEAHTPDVDGAVVRDKRILQEWLRDHAMQN
mmetsp:Transcript_26317/g.58480  ORF Transcript_26317/g.58480 Transcript_26317/m.58480 type:complete len:416 (-) Transcript_26317:243-1490(-)